jgi:23S rRNA pseudouridine1911/1915/1917 synthase
MSAQPAPHVNTREAYIFMKRRTLTAVGGLLSEELARALEMAPARAGELISAGAVYVDGKRCRESRPIAKGAQVIVVLEESGRAAAVVAARDLVILYEDARLIAVDKPPGVLAQPGPSGGENLVELVSKRLGREAGLVHRLDRETSGVTVFGKTREATRELAAAFRSREVKKRYLAVVTAELPDSGTIDLPLSKDPSRPGRWRATKKANGLTALTRYEVVERGAATLVALMPETGRTHQLRAHLAALGAPIMGDKLYGGVDGPRCLLHAHELVVGSLKVVAPLPDDLRRASCDG